MSSNESLTQPPEKSGADRWCPLVVVMPVFNDWDGAVCLLEQLDGVFAAEAIPLDVLVVDDGSTIPRPAKLLTQPSRSFRSVQVLTLWRNCGHQRAIAIALAHCHEQGRWARCLIMDSDGEDRPSDALALYRFHASHSEVGAVFAERRRRQEGLIFRAGYQGYRFVHWILTGIAVRVGNFSVVSAACLDRIVHMPDLWNHYAACVFKSRVPRRLVPTDRGRRYAGHSHMNLVTLVAHGFSALAVFRDVVAVRLSAAVFLAALILDVATIVHALSHGIDAVTLCLMAVAAGVTLQSVFGGIALAVTTLSARDNDGFLPARDCRWLIKEKVTIHTA